MEQWNSLDSFRCSACNRVRLLDLTHRDQYIGKVNYAVIGSNNGLSPDQRQAISETDTDMLVWSLGANENTIFIKSKGKRIWKRHLHNGCHLVPNYVRQWCVIHNSQECCCEMLFAECRHVRLVPLVLKVPRYLVTYMRYVTLYVGKEKP